MNLVAKANENPVAVRFPKPVLDAVTAAAKASGRSRNTEIVVRLAESLGLRDTVTAVSAAGAAAES